MAKQSLADRAFMKRLMCGAYPEKAVELYGADDPMVAVELSKKDLKAEAKQAGIRHFNSMSREELAQALKLKKDPDQTKIESLEAKAGERFYKSKEGQIMKKGKVKKAIALSSEGAKAMLKAKGLGLNKKIDSFTGLVQKTMDKIAIEAITSEPSLTKLRKEAGILGICYKHVMDKETVIKAIELKKAGKEKELAAIVAKAKILRNSFYAKS